MDKKHRRSPLVQEGLEIPVKIIIEIYATTRRKAIVNKYKQLVVANYKDDCTKDVLQELQQGQ